MSFGYSINDAVLGLKLVGTAISALRQTDGATAQYQKLQRDLVDLQHVLQFLQEVRRRPTGNTVILNTIAARAQISTSRLGTLLNSFQKYDSSLNHPSRWNKCVSRKLQWAFVESRKMKKLQRQIGFEMDIINALQHTLLL